MKKNIIILAAAALALGMTACTDEIVTPEIIDNSSEIGAEARVKSAADLIGTEWTYTMEDIYFVDENGDTVASLPLSDLVFGLNFDSTEAHLVFPAEVSMVSTTTDANGELTLEELGQMGFAYTYDLATTSGTLTATDNDVTGETIDMTIDFTYDVPNDGIIVYIPVAFDDDTNATTLQLVFARAN